MQLCYYGFRFINYNIISAYTLAVRWLVNEDTVQQRALPIYRSITEPVAADLAILDNITTTRYAD